MKSLPERIMGYAEAKPEATPIQAEDLLHLGDRAAVHRALSHLTRSERLMRIYRGIYMRPIQTRFGLRGPRRELALAALSELWDVTIVPNRGDAANPLRRRWSRRCASEATHLPQPAPAAQGALPRSAVGGARLIVSA